MTDTRSAEQAKIEHVIGLLRMAAKRGVDVAYYVEAGDWNHVVRIAAQQASLHQHRPAGEAKMPDSLRNAPAKPGGAS